MRPNVNIRQLIGRTRRDIQKVHLRLCHKHKLLQPKHQKRIQEEHLIKEQLSEKQLLHTPKVASEQEIQDLLHFSSHLYPKTYLKQPYFRAQKYKKTLRIGV